MKSCDYWKKMQESDTKGLLWLKVKSILRKEIISEFVADNKIELRETSLNGQFLELYNHLSTNPVQSHIILDKYIEKKDKSLSDGLDTNKLVAELYKLKTFDWGADYKKSLDKYLVCRYVKDIQSYDALVLMFETEISTAMQGYVLNSWYNHWSSILIEHIFKSHESVLPTVGQIKHVDFFIGNVPFDLKVTYLPAEYIKAKRNEFGFPVEMTFLKAKAKKLKIDFDKKAKKTGIYSEIIEKMKDRNTEECKNVIEKLKNEKMQILNEAKKNPRTLATWLYENQSEVHFGSENRLFLVLVDTEDFTGSWKLKRNMDLLKPVIKDYLDNFAKKKIADLKIAFKYKGKPQTFTAFTDVLFVVK